MRLHLLAGLLLAACTDTAKPDEDGELPEDSGGETGEPEEPTWSYEGETGPDHWGELSEEWATCSEGVEQSPVDLDFSIISEEAGPLPEFSWGLTRVRAYNPGHYIRYEVDPGSTLSYGENTYDLIQFHFHAYSEHTLDGLQTDLEMHFVHTDQANPDHLLVVAVMGDGAAEGGWEGALGEDGAMHFREALALPISESPTELSAEMNLGELFNWLPIFGMYTYSGSLTTPPCTEGVQFLVLDTVVPIDIPDIAAFHAVYDYNFRETQPLGARSITHRTPPAAPMD